MLTVDVDTKQLANSLLRAPRNQVPFAVAMALTRTAQGIQQQLKQDVDKRFTLRNNFVRNAIRFDKATKRDLSAVVGVATSARYDTDFMERQEFGGLKTPRGRHLAIPVEAGRGKRGIIRKSQRPRALLENEKRYFTGFIKGTYGLWKRVKKGELKLIYKMPQKGQVKERLGLRDTVGRQMQAKFNKNLFDALDYAARTAR